MPNVVEIDNRYASTIIKSLYEEYEALWIVDVDTQKLLIIKENRGLSIPGTVDTASRLTYTMAKEWYVDNYILEEDKERVRKDASIGNVLESLAKFGSFAVNYKRIHENSINYNQLVYSKLEAEELRNSFLLGFRDIDRWKNAEIDGITGLFNRQAFAIHAQHLLDTDPNGIYDFVMSDFVDFKSINELYGTSVGDQILAIFGKKLKQLGDSSSCVTGRFGGDQFAMLVKHDVLIEWMRSDTLEVLNLGDNLPKTTIKYGIYSNVKRSLSISDMRDRAYLALHNIKRNYGMKVAVYNNEIKDEVDKQRRIENSMHDSLVKNDFKVYYQPKHDADTGKIIGAEALIRWLHPEYGFISPGDFIPIFERNGFVTEADKYVLETACHDIRKWMDMGIEVVPISVNASKADFINVDMIERFNSAISKNNLTKDKIHIEITESLMEENTDELIEILNQLRKEGYQIELDDFGSGYSSINALSEFPIDVVKLDMSFMKQLDDEKRTKVLASCIGLAKNLGYKTVSEGVETRQQEELLRHYGVDAIQGYFYSKPLSEQDFEAYLLEEKNKTQER